jgi:ferredoxin-fold anticodon binding domain-containing protein
MNIEDLTIREIKQLQQYITPQINHSQQDGLNEQIGEKVIIRTYSAGVWFGLLDKKSGDEVILTNARRMWQWKAKKSISLSAVAKYGIDYEGSRIAPSTSKQWLKAIEIISLTDVSIQSIEDAKDDEAR